MDLSLIDKNLASPESIKALESSVPYITQVECPVVHRFGPGVYIREVFLRKGIIAIGHKHISEHMNIMLKGELVMVFPDGSIEHKKSPEIYTAPPGRKVSYILEDVVWLNVYPTTETDLDRLEEMIFDKSPEALEAIAIMDSRDRLKREVDRIDFDYFLDEYGLKESDVREISENEEDQNHLGAVTSRISDSPIEGKGYFVTIPYRPGDVIDMSLINGKRTLAGRYINHSKTPNAEMRFNADGDAEVVALVNISGCVGGSIGEEITVDYRQVLGLRG